MKLERFNFKSNVNLVKLVNICYRYEEKDIENVIIFIILTLSTGLII